MENSSQKRSDSAGARQIGVSGQHQPVDETMSSTATGQDFNVLYVIFYVLLLQCFSPHIPTALPRVCYGFNEGQPDRVPVYIV